MNAPTRTRRAGGARTTLDPGSRRPRGLLPLAARLLLAPALLFPALFVVLTLIHFGYPYPLEWMEGAMATHVGRVLAGQPLYVEPHVTFIPFTYTPLYVYAAAAVASLVGDSLLALRLVAACAAIASMVLIGYVVHRRTSKAWAGWLAGCLFAATYSASGFWFDIARNDTFALVLFLGGVALLVSPRGLDWRVAGIAGVLLGAAVLTKQSMAIAGVLLTLGLAVVSLRSAASFGVALLFATVVPSLLFWVDSDGWFLYYVWKVPMLHAIVPGAAIGFLARDFLPLLPALAAIAVVAVAVPLRPTRWWWLDGSAIAALVLIAFLTRLRAGSFENVLMPAHLAIVWMLAASLPRAWDVATPRWAGVAVALLVAAQLAMGLYDPRRLVPTAEDRAGYDQIVASLARVPGDVWLPGNGDLAERAGKASFAHLVGIVDVMLDHNGPGGTLGRELDREIAAQRWDIIVLDRETPGQPLVERWLWASVGPHYERYASMFAPAESTWCWTRTGHRVRPEFVYRPRQTPR